MKKKLIKMLTTRLFVALIVFSEVGWISLFGKGLANDFIPVFYAIIGISIVVSIYIFWKKSGLLKNKKVVTALVVFTIIGLIGWWTVIPELTDCRPYKCGEDFICARPVDLGMNITTGECTSDFPETVNFTCSNAGDGCKEIYE